MGLARCQHGRQLADGGSCLGQGRGAPCRISRAGNHGEQGLAHVADLAIAEDGVVMNDGAAVVDAGNIGCRDHLHHFGHGAHGLQRQRRQTAMGHGREPQGAVQRAFELGQVVDIGGLAGHMQVCGLVLAAHAHARALVMGLGLGHFVDAIGLVLAVVGKGFCHQFIRQFKGVVHFRLLAPRRREQHGASRSRRWSPRYFAADRRAFPATDAESGSAPP